MWAVAALVLAAGWIGTPAMAGNRSNEASQQTPAALYHNYCSVCHGDAGDGNSRAKGGLNPPPRDFTTAKAAQELTRDRMIAAVKTGVPGTAMVGWRSQMNDDQIAKVVDYVRGTFMRPSITDDNRGRQIYARVCSVCHGERGNGSMWASANLRPSPRDFSSAGAKAELTRDRMLAAVANGRPNTAMNGYSSRFTREDMEAVVDYIRTAFMRVEGDTGISGTHARGIPAAQAKAAEKAPAGKDAHAHHDHGGAAGKDENSHAAHGHGGPGKLDMKAPLPNGLKGDYVAGKAFYEANCATCHGNKGDGQGPRAYFINPKPAVFTSDKMRESLSRPVIFDGVSLGRRGTEMPAWDKVLTQQEIANVSEYVFRAFIQPGKGNVAKKK
jgi:mono/diheme cytochrome c family protein